MKLSVLCFGLLHLSFISAGLFHRSDVQPAGSSSGVTRSDGAAGAGSLNPGRKRPLFARSGQYERQRLQDKKPKKLPLRDLPPPPPPPPPPAPPPPDVPLKPKCSQLAQSCLPKAGCCDPTATCHCRFFNAICFCRRSSSLHKRNKT